MVDTSRMFFIDFELDSIDRYDIGKFMQWLIDNHDPLTANVFEEVKKLPIGGTFTIQGELERPDLVSHKIFGEVQYWWVILLYNGLTTFSTFENGQQIRFPLQSALEDYYFALKIKQDKQDKET